MVTIQFARAFERHVQCPRLEVSARTVRAALAEYFEHFPAVRGYVVDDRDALRPHVAVFVDGDVVEDRVGLTDELDELSVLHVFQALSGGAS